MVDFVPFRLAIVRSKWEWLRLVLTAASLTFPLVSASVCRKEGCKESENVGVLKALHSPSSRDLQPGSRSSLLKKWCNNNCFYVCLVLDSEDFCVLCALHVWGVVKVNLWSSGDIVLPLFCLLEKKFCTVSLQQSSNCLGGFSKSHHLDDSTVNLPKQNKESGRGSQRNASPFDRSWWTSSSNEMENNGNIPHQQRSTLSLSTNHNAQETQATTSDNVNNAAFVNHALILWTERRREWVGSQQRSQPEEHREPVIGWSTTYEDLLGTSRPFPQPIPLPEMVDFLVDVWEQEGLYE
ncbi:hypothetical protein BDL97_16G004500 [Sphagnum fallax]|nr:hypothetical protein BDL97_16G004500 [Sphagnum fallax]